MKALDQSPRLRYLSFAALYAVQGVPVGFITVAVFVWLAAQGRTTTEIGTVAAIAGIPWVLKLGWGPVVDRFQYLPMGRRRPWILGAQLVLVASALALTLVPDPAASLGLLAWLLFAQALATSLQDVAIDALAIDVFPVDQLGRANAFMFAGKILGFASGAAGLSLVIASLGFRTAVMGEAALVACLMLVPLLVREREGERALPWTRGSARAGAGPGESGGTRRLLRGLARALLTRSSLVLAFGMLVAVTANALAGAVLKVHVVQVIGWKQTELTGTLGAFGALTALAGAALAGTVADRIGHVRLLMVAVSALGLLALGFGLLHEHWQHGWLVTAYLVLDAFFLGAAMVGINALGMDLCWPAVAGSQFAVYMAVFNSSTALGQALAGPAVARLGVPTLLLVIGGVNLLAALFVRFVDPSQVRDELGRQQNETLA